MVTTLLIGRLIFGGFFLFMGIMHFKNLKSTIAYAKSKGTPLPALAVVISGLMIVIGGLGIIFGIYLNISLILIAIFLFFVTLKIHTFWKETDPNMKNIERVNFLKNAALFGATILFYVSLANVAS